MIARKKIQHQVYDLYQEGYRIDWIAKKLGIKTNSARSLLCMERRLLGIEPTRPNNIPRRVAKPKPQTKKLIQFNNGSDLSEWKQIGNVAKAVVDDLK